MLISKSAYIMVFYMIVSAKSIALDIKVSFCSPLNRNKNPAARNAARKVYLLQLQQLQHLPLPIWPQSMDVRQVVNVARPAAALARVLLRAKLSVINR